MPTLSKVKIVALTGLVIMAIEVVFKIVQDFFAVEKNLNLNYSTFNSDSCSIWNHQYANWKHQNSYTKK